MELEKEEVDKQTTSNWNLNRNEMKSNETGGVQGKSLGLHYIKKMSSNAPLVLFSSSTHSGKMPLSDLQSGLQSFQIP